MTLLYLCCKTKTTKNINRIRFDASTKGQTRRVFASVKLQVCVEVVVVVVPGNNIFPSYFVGFAQKIKCTQ